MSTMTQEQLNAIYSLFLKAIEDVGIRQGDYRQNIDIALDAFRFAMQHSENAKRDLFRYASRFYVGYDRKYDLRNMAYHLIENGDIMDFVKNAIAYARRQTNNGGSSHDQGSYGSMSTGNASNFGGLSSAATPAPAPQNHAHGIDVPSISPVIFGNSYKINTQPADIEFITYPTKDTIVSGPISVIAAQMGQYDKHRVSTSHVKCNLPVSSLATAADIITNYIPEELRRGNYLIVANIHTIKTIKNISSGKYQELIQQLIGNLPKEENSITIKDIIGAMRDFKQAEFNVIESIMINVIESRMFQWLRLSTDPARMLTGFKSYKDVEEILSPSCKYALVTHPGFEVVIKLITKSIYSELTKSIVATRSRNPGDLIISPYTYYKDPDGTDKTKYDVFNSSEDRDKILMSLMQEMTVLRRNKVILITNMLEDEASHPEFLTAWRNIVNSSQNDIYRYLPDRIVSLRQGAEPRDYLETFIPVTFIDDPNIVFPEKSPNASIPGLDYF